MQRPNESRPPASTTASRGLGRHLRELFRTEPAGGIVLFVAAALGFIVANSPLRGADESLLALHGEVLFVGKPLGVFSLTWITMSPDLAPLPPQASWRQTFGMAALCGIGFTMSLFIASLAYEDAGIPYAGVDRLGVIAGSLASGVAGYFILRRAPTR
jgi:Na+/H+ antiporter NhaA